MDGSDYRDDDFDAFGWSHLDDPTDDTFGGLSFENFTRRGIDNFTEAQRKEIAMKCLKQGKEDPWAYRARKNAQEQLRKARAQNQEQSKETREANAELPPVKKATLEFKLTLQQARMAKGMKQKDLATKVKVTVNVIAEWESGKSLPTGPQRAMLNRVLGISLPKM